ncbi:hypothetical protein QZM22_21015 [Burkholderia oklahomensis]|uniref:hypothetical protein n=1 Tax=Burkholderia oklahomensis TaxID=342113 RepID=UPI0026570291|nr:hypothetical protein [Burkholderia oklahomensis]MDN7674933.1 hypothetical protein [Burkholderia oklahomensis]
MANGHSLETVQILLGHAHLDHVAPYLDVSERERREADRAFDTQGARSCGPSDWRSPLYRRSLLTPASSSTGFRLIDNTPAFGCLCRALTARRDGISDQGSRLAQGRGAGFYRKMVVKALMKHGALTSRSDG